MCGRYVSPDEAAVERAFNLVHHEWQFPVSFNVAPTQSVPVVRIAADGERVGALMHWGLIPYWAKGIAPKYSTINATIEKLTEAATWRGPWSRGQRCILPATGFYEWQVQPSNEAKVAWTAAIPGTLGDSLLDWALQYNSEGAASKARISAA